MKNQQQCRRRRRLSREEKDVLDDQITKLLADKTRPKEGLTERAIFKEINNDQYGEKVGFYDDFKDLDIEVYRSLARLRNRGWDAAARDAYDYLTTSCLIKCCGFSEGRGAMALSNLGVRMLGIKSKNGVPFGNLPSPPASCSVS